MDREVERACSLVVCEDGTRLQRSSLPDLQRVLPILVSRYHAVRRDKDKLQLAFTTLSREAQLLPGTCMATGQTVYGGVHDGRIHVLRACGIRVIA